LVVVVHRSRQSPGGRYPCAPQNLASIS